MTLAQEISAAGKIDMQPWTCVGVKFIDTLPQETQEKLNQIKESWIELYGWVVAQMACSGSTVFGVPHIGDDVINQDIIMLWCFLHYASLADSKNGCVKKKP